MAREMKDSGVPWIGKIPADWPVDRIKIHFTIVSGSGFPVAIQGFEHGDYPVAKAGDIAKCGKDFDKSINFISKEVANQYGFSIIPTGSILFAKIGEAMKKNNRAISSVDCCVDNNCEALVPIDVNGEWSYYLLMCIDMVWFDNASTIPCINNQRLRDCYIPLPHLQVQQCIASFLDKQCAKIDVILEKVRSSIEEYKKLKQAIITRAVTKGIRDDRPMKDSGIIWLGDVPESWNISKIKHTFFPHEKPVLPTDEVITCFRDGTVTLRKNKREEGYTISFTEKGYQGVDIGDLVIHGMDTFAGAIGCSDSRGKISPVVHVCSTSGNNRYFMYFLRYMASSNVLMDFSNGVRIRSSDFRNFDKLAVFEVLVPSLDEQNEIVNFLDDCTAKIEQMIGHKERLIEEIEAYKKSLIYEYVTGKKEV